MRSILIVDDDSGIRLILSLMIRRCGEFRISEAGSLAEAAFLCEENRYDTIFLDHHLKDGIGWEIAKKISLDPQKYGSPAIVVMSGSVPVQNAGKSGIHYSQFLPKPFEFGQIESILGRFSGGAG